MSQSTLQSRGSLTSEVVKVLARILGGINSRKNRCGQNDAVRSKTRFLGCPSQSRSIQLWRNTHLGRGGRGLWRAGGFGASNNGTGLNVSGCVRGHRCIDLCSGSCLSCSFCQGGDIKNGGKSSGDCSCGGRSEDSRGCPCCRVRDGLGLCLGLRTITWAGTSSTIPEIELVLCTSKQANKHGAYEEKDKNLDEEDLGEASERFPNCVRDAMGDRTLALALGFSISVVVPVTGDQRGCLCWMLCCRPRRNGI